MPSNLICEIDFDRWAALACSDPQKFEQLRQDKIAAVIAKAKGTRIKRLQGLQWQIDNMRAQHKNSTIAACLAISELMWETFHQLADVLQSQEKGDSATVLPCTKYTKANIIPFPH